MDVELLIANLGSGFLTCDLYNVLKCPKCKSRKFLFMLTPVHFSYGDAPRENHSKATTHQRCIDLPAGTTQKLYVEAL